MRAHGSGGTAGTGFAHEISALCEGRVLAAPQPPPSRGSGGVFPRRHLAETGLRWATPGTRPLSGAGSGRAPSALPEGTEPAQTPSPTEAAAGMGSAAVPGAGGGWPGSGCSPGAPLRSAPRHRPRLRRLSQAPKDEQSRRIKEPCVCGCGGDALQRLPVPLPPAQGALPLSAPGLSLAGCRGTETCSPRPHCILLSFCGTPSPGEGICPGLSRGLVRRGWGCPPGALGEAAGARQRAPGAPRQRSRVQWQNRHQMHREQRSFSLPILRLRMRKVVVGFIFIFVQRAERSPAFPSWKLVRFSRQIHSVL